MMKKMLVMLLVGTMSMSALTGCGKSEEEKAADEIAEHIRDEAADDGVDIDKMLEEEQAQYEEQYEAEMDEIERQNLAKTELGDFAEEKMTALASVYNEYKDAKWEEDEAKMQELADNIRNEYESYRNEYNELRDELLEKYNLDTLPTAENQSTTRFDRLTGGGNIHDFMDY